MRAIEVVPAEGGWMVRSDAIETNSSSRAELQ